MNKEDIIRMAREAGLQNGPVFVQGLERFAALVAAHEREKVDLRQAAQQEPVAWMVYTQEGQSVYVTDNPTDIQEGQRALPLYTDAQHD